MDARDLLFQREPLGALANATARLGMRGCALTLASDCHKCSAVSDDYFRRWARCLPSKSMYAIGDRPPVNGGIVLGRATAMRRLYFSAALLAATAKDEACLVGGREQHLLTAAALALRARRPAEVCVLPNDLRQHAAFFNMGVSNTIDDVRLSEREQRVQAAGGDSIGIVHQFDRRPTVLEFLKKHGLAGADAVTTTWHGDWNGFLHAKAGRA